jgi:hypothetical protein
MTNRRFGRRVTHQFNEHDDLSAIITDRYRLDFTTNEWGWPSTVRVDGSQPYTLLGDRNNLVFNGPNNSEIHFNQEGSRIFEA